MLLSMTDCIVRIRYTAKVGEPTFVSKVIDLVDEFESVARNSQVKGVGQS
jgi:hypothetical protein